MVELINCYPIKCNIQVRYFIGHVKTWIVYIKKLKNNKLNNKENEESKYNNIWSL